MKKMILFFTAVVISLLVFNSFKAESLETGDPWPIPEKYQKMKNPFTADKESLSIGKSLYSKHCKSCHGKEGLGDGPKADQLDTPSGDFTDEDFQAQPDGALFYKTREGRDDMPSFKKKIPDTEDVWHVINYLRTFE
jgi:mono/diheme cytochrome c family protein